MLAALFVVGATLPVLAAPTPAAADCDLTAYSGEWSGTMTGVVGTFPFSFSITVTGVGAVTGTLTSPPDTGPVTGTATCAQLQMTALPGQATANLVGVPDALGLHGTGTLAIHPLLGTVSVSWSAVRVVEAPDPAVDGSAVGPATQKVGYAAQLAAVGGTAVPGTWALDAGKLPKGLALAASGSITGVPKERGTFPIRVRATVEVSPGDQVVVHGDLDLRVLERPAIQPSALPPAVAGSSYLAPLTASGGPAPFAWEIVAGALPPGLALAGGAISGVPTAAGGWPVTVEATSAEGAVASRKYTIRVTRPSVSIDLGAWAPTGRVGEPYGAALTAVGGVAPWSWRVTSGSLPPGLALDPGTGAVTGIPTAAGRWKLTVEATDSTTPKATKRSQKLELDIRPDAVAVAPPALPEGQVKTAYSVSLVASGGTKPYKFQLGSGSLPPGLKLSAAGKITGKPTSAGAWSFAVDVTDKFGYAGTRIYTFSVTP